MHVAWLELRDVRCYEELSFQPDSGVNVLVGDNGEGKTSVLEGLGYLGLMKSFRLVGDDALVREGASSAVIRGGVGGAATEITVECELPLEGRRTVLVNGKRPQRMREVQAMVPVVTFMPDDLDVVKRGPGLRRDYLDDLASQLWPRAGADLSDYDRALRQRNSLLRQEGRATDPVTLDVWDTRLAAAAAGVLAHRRAVAAALQPHLSGAYEAVGGNGDLRWAYRSTWGSDDAADEESLVEAMSQALARPDPVISTCGPPPWARIGTNPACCSTAVRPARRRPRASSVRLRSPSGSAPIGSSRRCATRLRCCCSTTSSPSSMPIEPAGSSS